jgi:hypothetical protein
MPAHNNFRERWVEAGYGSSMASSVACLPPQNPLMRRVYNLNSAAYALQNIEKGRLKLSRFADVNDPFELLGLNLQDRNARKIAQNNRSGHNESTGLLCFAGDWAEPVLWSHYGDKHRGICLGFNVPITKLQKVQYADARIVTALSDHVDVNNLPLHIQTQLKTTKSRGWAYEQEYRQFISLTSDLQNENGLQFIPFCRELELAEVILGANCGLNPNDVRKIVQARVPTAVTFKARLAFQSFHVVPDERSIL